jgi:endonuclease G
MDQQPGTEKSISIDPNYTDRNGYAPGFLGADHIVSLPALSSSQQANVALLAAAKGASGAYVLNYYHFSIVMNKQRRLAYFTAVNIDGKRAQHLNRESDRWIYDPRIDKAYQIGPELYSDNDLDFGHLVRRLDPTWGTSLDIAKLANDDTFHYTNCSPQHKLFNRNKSTWAGLEDYIFSNAIADNLKVTVFTGPVFGGTDPEYRGVKLPQSFWKVVVMVKQDGSLSATGYLLDQSSLIGDIEKGLFSYGAYKTYQVSVRQIQALTGLQFDNLTASDPLDGAKDLEPKELASLADIQW